MTHCDIALVGCGDIAQKQHARFLLSGGNDTGLRLVATADPRAALPGFAGRHYPDHSALLAAEPNVAAVSIASPTATHFAIARDALLAGRHVLLEKPPTTTLGELIELDRIATELKVVLVTSFHSRHNAAVAALREILSGRRKPKHISMTWREDFERWHAGQTWPWRPGGFGVFDPGINALSILCHVLPELEFSVEQARFRVPIGAATPAYVGMRLAWDGAGTGDVTFEWRKGGKDVWDIAVRGPGDAGRTETLLLRGVRTLLRDGAVVLSAQGDVEYAGVYRGFARALKSGMSEVSFREMRIIEEAALVADVESSETAF
ncbi:Gfo/Idh/MocA family protein [Roseomonas sp. GCM10028921]